jgi:hypothetical protein
MSAAPPSVTMVPCAIDLSALVQRSVASLYSHLVTRPTGRALRVGIETQIRELGACCVSVLDFRQVVILDYSCADEIVAKLIQRYSAPDRPAEAYFVARGLGDHHREPIEAVLLRHRLALVAEVGTAGFSLVGEVSPGERSVWAALQLVRSGSAEQVARALDGMQEEVETLLERLVERRTAVRSAGRSHFVALTSLLGPAGASAPPLSAAPGRRSG